MGCNNTKSAETTDDKEAPKQFHNMTEEEKEKVKKEIEEQDKDIEQKLQKSNFYLFQ